MSTDMMARTFPDWRFAGSVKQSYSRECRLKMNNIAPDSMEEFSLPTPDVRGVTSAWAQRLPYGLRIWFEYYDDEGQNCEHCSTIYTTDAHLDPITGDPVFGSLKLA